uniref:Uncharacterized protein n=1 Tax=Brassica oleracea var. oleracea TaxID=109376 RepID=A0A0D3D5Z7_BRAOL
MSSRLLSSSSSVLVAGGGLAVKRHGLASKPVRTVNLSVKSRQTDYFEKQRFGDSSSSSQNGEGGPARFYVGHSISKGKAALTVEPKTPEFASLDSGAFKLSKDGFLLLQFAPAAGVRQYDWSKKGETVESDEISEEVYLPLKESIGHTEVEVIAGALFGFLVSFGVYSLMSKLPTLYVPSPSRQCNGQISFSTTECKAEFLQGIQNRGGTCKCGVISPRSDVGVKEIECWTARLLPSETDEKEKIETDERRRLRRSRRRLRFLRQKIDRKPPQRTICALLTASPPSSLELSVRRPIESMHKRRRLSRSSRRLLPLELDRLSRKHTYLSLVSWEKDSLIPELRKELKVSNEDIESFSV